MAELNELESGSIRQGPTPNASGEGIGNPALLFFALRQVSDYAQDVGGIDKARESRNQQPKLCV